MPLSFSKLRLYRTCPRQYEYAVIKKLPRGISPEESFGSSVHNCLKKWGEMELERQGSGQRSVASGQMGMFSDHNKETDHSPLTTDHLLELWHQSFIVDTYSSRVEADFHRQRGEKLMQRFFEWWSSRVREVVAVEKSFSLDLDGVKLSGRIDRIEKFRTYGNSPIRQAQGGEFRIRVVDYKTTKPCSQEEVDADLQLSIYALAVNELFSESCSELSFLYIGEDGVVERVTGRTEGQLKGARKQILSLKGSIESGEFHPIPSVGVCKRCPFKGVCDVSAVSSTP